MQSLDLGRGREETPNRPLLLSCKLEELFLFSSFFFFMLALTLFSDLSGTNI